MLYEHVDKDGNVTEKVRPAENSKNAAALAAKAVDDESGWRKVDDAPAAPEKASQPQDGATKLAAGKQPLAPDKAGS